MSSPGDPDIVTATGFPAHLSAVPAPRDQRQVRDPSLRMDDQGAKTLPLAGQPGRGRAASLRRQPGRVVDGRMEGAPTSAFELICPGCGDHRYLDYSEVSPRLQRIRGPYTLEAGLTAYEMHFGLFPRLHEVTPGRSGGPKPAAMRASLLAGRDQHLLHRHLTVCISSFTETRHSACRLPTVSGAAYGDRK